MKITKETPGPTEVVLNIELTSEDEQPFINRSYRRVVNRIQIPGFRRGKAPRSIVESYLGRTALVQEALEFMIPETLDRVLKEEDLKAFSQPQVDILDLEPVSFKAVVPLEPLVDLGDFRSLRVESEPVSITDERVNEVIEGFRRQTAPWEPVNRPAQFGDLLNLNVKGAISGQQVLDDHGVDYIAEKENAMPFPGFSIHLEGLTEGQEKEFSLPVPADYRSKEYAGKECHFRVKVLSIKEKKLASLDDEFAKGVGDGYESLEALRDFVRKRLTEEAEKEATRKVQEEGVGQLLKTASVQASELIVQREIDLMREERERALKNYRVDMETYLKSIGKTEDELLAELRPQAQARLNRHLVLRKLAQEEGIEVSSDELDAEIETLVSSSAESPEGVRRALSRESAKESLRSSILTRKVIERLGNMVQGHANESNSGGTSNPEAFVEGAESNAK